MGARVIATARHDGYELSVSDPYWRGGKVIYDYAAPDLGNALSIARAILEHHLRIERRVEVDWNALFAVQWKRLQPAAEQQTVISL